MLFAKSKKLAKERAWNKLAVIAFSRINDHRSLNARDLAFKMGFSI